MNHALRLSLILCLLLASCVTDGPPAPSPAPTGVTGRIDAIEMMALPTAVRATDGALPDAVQVRIYFFNAEKPAPLIVESGRMEFFLYDGRVPEAPLTDKAPFVTWAFNAADLSGTRTRALGGDCYDLLLRWGDKPPSAATVTLVAIYRPPSGRAIASAPTLLSIRTR